MELGFRPGPLSAKRYVATLADCVVNCSASSGVQKGRQRAEQDVARLFDTREQEAADIPDKRPCEMKMEQQHRLRDLITLPRLHNLYDTKLSHPGATFWQVQVQRATENRIKLSHAPRCEGGQDNNSTTLGPWSRSDIQQDVEARNEDVLFDAMHGDGEDDNGNDNLLQDMANEACDDDDEDDFYQDTAKDCDGWEEDNMRNGE
jgi:hypothetical protein